MKTKQITALEQAIKESGLKIMTVSDRSAIPYMRLYALRHGTSKPTFWEAGQLAKALNRIAEELFPENN